MKKFRITYLLAAALLTACTQQLSPEGSLVRKSTALFVATDRHENGEGNNLAEMLKITAAESEITPSMVFIGGDNVGLGREADPEYSIEDLYNEIDSTLAPPYRDVAITYGSHDINCTEGYSAFFSGPRHCDGYYIYGISYAQMIFATDASVPTDPTDTTRRVYQGLDLADRYGISAESASENFVKWVYTLTDNLPIVVMSHVPMHAVRRDNLGASTWYNALSEAARDHDVIVLWGHNHTMEEREISFEDRNNYLLTPGDEITLQSPVDSVTIARRLPFTYANAGYLKLGRATVITFQCHSPYGHYDTAILRRFALNPDETEQEFGTTGRSNPYTLRLKKWL